MKRPIIILTILALLSGPFDVASDTAPTDGAKKTSEWDEAEGLIVQTAPIYRAEGTVYTVPGLDFPAVPTLQVSPLYPAKLKANRVQGTVNVVFIVNELGNVISPNIEKSSNREFNQSALDAVLQWKYKPAMKDGQPVKVKVRQPISFTLRR